MLARQAKGINREGLAKAVAVSDSLVRAWERGQRLPRPEVLATVERVLELSDGVEPGILCRIRNDLIKDAVPLEWFGRWREAETRAKALWTVQPLLIPGLLQTPEYAGEVLRAARRNAELEEMVSERLRRQEILTSDDPPLLVALIAEAALRHAIVDPKTMRDQLLHLVDMAARGTAIIQIVPADSPACAGFLSGFVIASIEGNDDLAYVDNQLTGEVIEDAEDVLRLRRMFEEFRAESLRAKDSIVFMEKVVEELWTE